MKIPIVKQSGTAARDIMFDTKLSEATSRAVERHLQFMEDCFGTTPPLSCPLFCSPARDGKPPKKSIGIYTRIEKTRKLISGSIGDIAHHEFFTRRFKHTKLTHLAILGAPLQVLARAGYQTSTVSLRHYTNLTDEAFVQYERQMSEAHDDIFSAFRGEIIEKAEVTQPGLQNRILAPDLTNDLGACTDIPCEAFAPVACYTCPRFEAFSDGPHEEVLALLLKRQALAAQMDLPRETTNRDMHLISAVKFVIKKIEENKKHG